MLPTGLRFWSRLGLDAGRRHIFLLALFATKPTSFAVYVSRILRTSARSETSWPMTVANWKKSWGTCGERRLSLTSSEWQTCATQKSRNARPSMGRQLAWKSAKTHKTPTSTTKTRLAKFHIFNQDSNLSIPRGVDLARVWRCTKVARWRIGVFKLEHCRTND